MSLCVPLATYEYLRVMIDSYPHLVSPAFENQKTIQILQGKFEDYRGGGDSLFAIIYTCKCYLYVMVRRSHLFTCIIKLSVQKG